MNASKLRGLRVEKGHTQSSMAKIICRSLDTYAKKERGEVACSPREMCLIATALNMSFDLFNIVFFDGNLPFGNILGEHNDPL